MLALAGALSVSNAAAEEPTPSAAFIWEAPAECPSRQEVLERFSEVLGPRGHGREAEAVLGAARVRGQIAGERGRWTLELQVRDESGPRVRALRSAECSELAHAAALALALLLEEAATHGPASSGAAADPRAAAREPVRTEPSSLPGEDPSDADAPPLAEPASDAERLAISAGVDGLLDSSTLGQLAVGARLSVEAGLGLWRLATYAAWLPARRLPLRGASQAVEFEHWALGLRPCRELWGAQWALEACASGELGRVLARGLDLDQSSDVANSWGAAGLGVGLRWHRSGGAVQARTELMVPLWRQRYVVNTAQVVHDTPAVALRFALGFQLEL